MHLVDLAGSERGASFKIGSTKILTESKHINLSLHYLEMVCFLFDHSLCVLLISISNHGWFILTVHHRVARALNSPGTTHARAVSQLHDDQCAERLAWWQLQGLIFSSCDS
jgi:hypothetical protein